MLEGLEPVGDAPSNILDRRLLFEVTGLELIDDEFKGEDSSDLSDLDREDASGGKASAASIVAPLMLNPDTDSDEDSFDSEMRGNPPLLGQWADRQSMHTQLWDKTP